MSNYVFIMANEGPQWGGSEFLWSSAAEHLARQGNHVVVSAKPSAAPIPQIEHLRSAGCEVLYRPPVIPPITRRLVRKIIPHPTYHEEHMHTIGRDANLVVISQGSNTDGLDWMDAARASGHRYAVISHSAAVHQWPNDDLAERLAECYDNATAAYFVSQAVLDLSRRQFGSPLKNGRVVRNPFNVRYNARPLWPTDPSDGLRLACVGRLHVISKGQDVLLQVLGLSHWKARQVRVSIVGTGPHERALRRLAAQTGLASVEFCGHRQDIEEIWRQHHALVLPSRFEGMPLALVEAMICGRPAIVTDVGGNRELVCDHVNGFLAKAATVELLDEAMNRAWENRHRLREMGEAAARDARQWVSPDPTGDFVRELELLVKSKAQ